MIFTSVIGLVDLLPLKHNMYEECYIVPANYSNENSMQCISILIYVSKFLLFCMLDSVPNVLSIFWRFGIWTVKIVSI